jgi:hypothetical protein
MADFIETLRNTPLTHIFIIVAIALVAHFLSRRRIDKMEKKLFGDDAERYRADANGVSPFDRPPKGFDEAKAAEQADALRRAKEGSTTEPTVSEVKRD